VLLLYSFQAYFFSTSCGEWGVVFTACVVIFQAGLCSLFHLTVQMLVKLVSTVIRIRFQVNPATLLIPIYFSYMIGGGVPGTKVAPFLIDVRKNFHCPCSFSFSLLVIQKLQHMCAQSPTYPCALAHTCTYMHTHIPTAVPLECEMPEARSECCGEVGPTNGHARTHMYTYEHTRTYSPLSPLSVRCLRQGASAAVRLDHPMAGPSCTASTPLPVWTMVRVKTCGLSEQFFVTKRDAEIVINCEII
jgi:hypothetical protein